MGFEFSAPTGPIIYWQLSEKWPAMLRNVVTQSTVTLFFVTIVLIIVALIVNKNIKKRPGKFQVIVEKLVTMLYGMVSHRRRFTALPAVLLKTYILKMSLPIN